MSNELAVNASLSDVKRTISNVIILSLFGIGGYPFRLGNFVSITR